ncbi:hypothetical protein OAZ24_05290, partial [Synechococcus sp. AH-736-G21]|nr:hypothetical protein [Synechococcus sp. AH-736-G21]
TGDSTVTMKVWNNSGLDIQMKSLSTDAVFGEPTRISDNYTDAELVDGAINFTGGLMGVKGTESEGIFTVPVTLKSGLESPPVDFSIQFNPAIIPPLPENPQPGDMVAITPGQCDDSAPSGANSDGPTTVYYSINGGATQSAEATCGMIM